MHTSYWGDIKQSLYNLIDHKLLEAGAYFNVTGGQKNIQGQDVSQLFSVTDDALYSVPGHIWQSAFHNFVYESGVNSQPTPIVASGVIIDGTFTPKSNTIHIDYVNGRVIFDTAISTSSVVQMAFSHKEYSFIRPDNSKPFYNQTRYTSNSNVYKNLFPAQPDAVYLPAVIIEIDNSEEKAFQLGGTHETLPTFKISIISDQQADVENIASVISSQSTKSIPIVASNLGPKFNFYYDITENYSFCQWFALSQNFAYVKSVKYSRIFDSKSDNAEPSLYGGNVIIDISAIR